MRTVRTLTASADRLQIWTRFPIKTLALSLALLIGGFLVWSLVDRVVPPAAAKPVVEKPASAAKPALGRAAPEKARPDLVKNDQPFSAGALLAVFGVLGGAVGSMFLMKRFLKGSRRVPSGRKILQVRDVLAIGPKRAIYLIGLENRNLVLGVTGDQFTLLSEYSAEQDEDAPAATPAAETTTIAPQVRMPAAAPSPAAAPARLDIEVGEEITVPAVEPAHAAPKPVAGPRAFSFGAATPGKRVSKPNPERVPHKFRQLLEQAAAAEEMVR